jgi:hypothetical protein
MNGFRFHSSSFQSVRSCLVVTVLLAFCAGIRVEAQVSITKVPYTITKSGSYTLYYTTLKYSGTANAITVNADDVVIDLRGRTLQADPAQSLVNQTAGIFANGRKNITIKNGRIKNFFRGIFLEGSPQGDSEGHLVEGMEVIDSMFLGIQVKGNGCVVRRNFINKVGIGGGSTSFMLQRFGIYAGPGAGMTISENRIFNVYRNETFNSYISAGIHLQDCYFSQIQGNELTTSDLSGTRCTYGIDMASGSSNIIARNTLTGQRTGIMISSTLPTVYRDNTVVGSNTAYQIVSGATNGGGNQ